uniref:SXP/RAL-2 family protein Ani s 5-like cation-binding domain-containing protein n=1 Tax=Panagrellus redivivus TaxID=6233 RepID=A0A7E4WAB6_PANRE
MNTFAGFVALALVAVVIARPQGGPGGFPPIPDEIKRVLPADTVAKLEAIHNDPALGFREKHTQIDKIMSALPADVLDKIPPPPGFAKLPASVQQQLKDINRSTTLNWEEKQAKTRQVIESLPEEQKRLFPPPPPPPPAHRGFRGFF